MEAPESDVSGAPHDTGQKLRRALGKILGKACVVGGRKSEIVLEADAPRRPAERPLGGDVDVFGSELSEEQRERIMERIRTELDLIGIGVRYRGRAYLEEAIFALVNKEKKSSEAVIYQVAEDRKATYGGILRAIQTAIHNAWETSAIEDLQKYYTARINIHTGVPSPTEFIHYYADKIRKTM